MLVPARIFRARNFFNALAIRETRRPAVAKSTRAPAYVQGIEVWCDETSGLFGAEVGLMVIANQPAASSQWRTMIARQDDAIRPIMAGGIINGQRLSVFYPTADYAEYAYT